MPLDQVFASISSFDSKLRNVFEFRLVSKQQLEPQVRIWTHLSNAPVLCERLLACYHAK